MDSLRRRRGAFGLATFLTAPFPREFLLRAERSGLGPAACLHRVDDGSGNFTVRQASVPVPFDMR